MIARARPPARILATTRRRALIGSALALPFVRRAAAAEPIRIGMVLAKQGPISIQARDLARGGFFALAQQNNTILGRPAEIVWLDEANPQMAQQNAEKLVTEQKVVALIGGSLSSYALAIEAYAGRAKIPYVANNAAATEITGKDCNRYTFRVNPPVAVQARAMAPYLEKIGKRWYFITASYAFGQDIANSFKQILHEIGGTDAGSDSVPVGTPDYSSYVLKIREAKPDLVIGGLTSGDLSNFLKQWKEFGLLEKIPFTEIAVGDTDLWSIGPAVAAGLYTSLWWYKDPNNSPADQAYAAAFEKQFHRPASDKTWMGWIAMRSLLESIESARSTEPMAIVEALESWRISDGAMPVYYRKWDHQFVHRMLILKVKRHIPDAWDYFDVIESSPATQAAIPAVFGTEQGTACHMRAS
jgi:branched-chain amino acid transport system substrate-binding protein